MTDFTEIKNLIVAQGDAWEQFKAQNDARFAALEEDSKAIQKKMARQSLAGNGDAKPNTSREIWIDAKSRQPIHVLGQNDSLAAIDCQASGGIPSDLPKGLPSIGRLMRGIILGGRADDARELADERKALSIGEDPSGGYTVAGALSNEWIDALRAQMVLSRAGVRTVPMDSKTLSIARVNSDATAGWHAENADLSATDPTFGMGELNAKTVYALVRFSLELGQDSANIEEILSTTLTNALATEIDRAGLVGSTTNAASAPQGLFNFAGINKVTSIGAPANWDFLIDGAYELMVDNVPEASIGAMIGHPAIWRKMAKLKTGLTNDETPLPLPDAVSRIPKLWTTAAPLTGGTTAKAMMGNWADYLFGIRQQITVRVLSEAFLGSNLQLAVLAYARCDFLPTRQQSFVSMEGITVA